MGFSYYRHIWNRIIGFNPTLPLELAMTPGEFVMYSILRGDERS